MNQHSASCSFIYFALVSVAASHSWPGLMFIPERTWLEQGGTVGENVVPLARNFGGGMEMDVEADEHFIKVCMAYLNMGQEGYASKLLCGRCWHFFELLVAKSLVFCFYCNVPMESFSSLP